MKKYSFEMLTWFDFENLTRDVIQTRDKINLESFGEGRDEGIDFRHCSTKNKKTIVQSKLYSNFSKLMTSLKNEKLKLSKLKPDRYILAISLDLTPARKQKIFELFTPYIKHTKDIMGRGDIENIIDQNEDVLKRNYKLWFTSAAVLDILNDRKISGRSQHLKLQIANKAKLYVETKNIQDSLDIMHKQNIVIISGIPGIGKTTLAEMLTLYHLENGYDIRYVTSIDEIEESLDENKKQIFYYDDFLGKNFLKAPLYKNEDSRLVDLFQRISSSKKSKMVMTTREYIMKQAQNELEALDRDNLEIKKLLISLDDYSDFQKAQILYNHLYFSSFSKKQLREFLALHGYKDVIEHKNYSPRLIEMVIKNNEDANEGPGIYAVFMETLNNPLIIWEKAFDNQISESGRILLYSLLMSRDNIMIEDLETVFYNFARVYNRLSHIPIVNLNFKTGVKELDDSFIKIDVKFGHNFINFHNPSVADFLISRISGDKMIKEVMIESSSYLLPLIENFGVEQKGTHKIRITKEEQTLIFDRVIDQFFHYKDVAPEDTLSVLQRLYLLFQKEYEHNYPKLKSFIKTTIVNNVDPDYHEEHYMITYFFMLDNLGLLTPDLIYSEIRKIINESGTVEDLEDITMLVNDYEKEFYEVINEDNISIQELFSDIFGGYTNDLSEFDEYQLSSTFEQAEEFERILDIDLTDEKENVSYGLARLHSYDYEDMENYGPLPSNEDKEVPESSRIDSLFSTLL